MTPTGLEHPTQNTAKTAIPEIGGAKSGALSPEFGQLDPSDLQAAIDASDLPETVKAGVLAMLGAARKTGQ
jgi:hypothetical protein